MKTGFSIFLYLIGCIVTEEPACYSHFDYHYRIAQKLVQLENKIEQHLLQGVLSVYVRWGKNSCPDEASLVYSGYAGGKIYSEKGSGSDTLCLPSDPTWSRFTDGDDHPRAHIYGTETDVPDSTSIFGYNVNNQDTPCAVCSVQRSVTLMIPGRSNCYTGWKLEYGGYLMSQYHGHPGPHNYVCVDSNPEFVPNSSANNNQHVLYLVEAKCGSLPCPPYVQGILSVYVRWGRNSCPDEASLVYNGYAGGKTYSDKGSGSDTLCLPSDPTWSRYKDGDDYPRAHIYGTETDVTDATSTFEYNVNNQDTPCAVCSVQRSATLMIPGRSNCYSGWKLEYGGYLMSEYHDHPSPHDYICVDSNPEFVPNSGTNNNQHILYLVEAKCGSLPCPPYVQGREIACVVCSK